MAHRAFPTLRTGIPDFDLWFVRIARFSSPRTQRICHQSGHCVVDYRTSSVPVNCTLNSGASLLRESPPRFGGPRPPGKRTPTRTELQEDLYLALVPSEGRHRVTGWVATDGTAACSPAPTPCLISLRIVRRFSRIVFTHAKRPICGK